MTEPKRTPGQAEGTEQDIDIALNDDQEQRQKRADAAHNRENLSHETGRTPEQAEGTEEQAEGSLRKPK